MSTPHFSFTLNEAWRTELLIASLLEEHIVHEQRNTRRSNSGETHLKGKMGTKLPTSGAFLKEADPPSDYPLAGCLEAHHAVVVGAFNNALDSVHTRLRKRSRKPSLLKLLQIPGRI